MTHTVRTLFLNSFKHGCEYKCFKSKVANKNCLWNIKNLC